MFNKEKNTAYTAKSNSNNATLISAGTVVKGDVHSDHDLRIDGTIHGNVSSSSRIVVGPTGYVEGNILGSHADVTGRVLGDIQVSEMLQLRESCKVDGNISAAQLQVDPTASFNGKCQMGTAAGSIVSMSLSDAQTAEA